MIREACGIATTAPKPEANSLSKVDITDQRDAVLAVGDDRDLLFLQVGYRLDLLAAGAE
jgi:hypothetical protein